MFNSIINAIIELSTTYFVKWQILKKLITEMQYFLKRRLNI